MTAIEDTRLHGVVDMPERDYHLRPELSSSGARRLLPPSCPALYRYKQTHPEFKDVFDFGHAAHKLVLGAGQELDVIDADDYRTKDAKAHRDLARVEGRIPILRDDYRVAQTMAEAVLAHPVARAVLDAERGKAEQSLFWRDVDTGAGLRARVDWLPNGDEGSRLICADYKTTVSAHPDAFARSCSSFGYHMQHAFYLDGARSLDLGEDPAFVFVAQEKSPPFLVNVIELDADAARLGAAMNRRAIDLYAQCLDADYWPGYGEGVTLVELPAWYSRMREEEYGI